MAYSFPHTLTPGTPENVTDVMDNFTGHAADTEYAYSTYKTIHELVVGLVAGTNISSAATFVLTPLSGGAVLPSNSSAAAGVFRLDPADYTAGSRTTKYRVRVTLVSSTTASGVNNWFGLYPVSATSGGQVTLGSLSGGAEILFGSSANLLDYGVTADFTAPAAGALVFGLRSAGAWNVASNPTICVQLQMRQV